MTVKDKNDRKRMKQAKTQDMQALWKCTKTGGTKLVEFNSWGLFEYEKGENSISFCLNTTRNQQEKIIY